MPEKEKNKKLSRLLPMLINCFSDPALMIDAEDRMVSINRQKSNPYPIESQIGANSPNAMAGESWEKWSWR